MVIFFSYTQVSLKSKNNKDEKMLAYCVKCKEKRQMKNAHESVTSHGRHMMKGSCPVCKHTMCCFVKKKGSVQGDGVRRRNSV
jgi:hypothetical protein